MDTRSRFIDAALRLFAEKGFYGASMDHIARELGLTKQTLIHHFGTKEKLYSAVLQEISRKLLADLNFDATNDAGPQYLDALLLLFHRTQSQPMETQLLMRELLDNRSRAEQASTWHLKPLLDGLSRLLAQVPGWEKTDLAQRATRTYQLLGAINYFTISNATLSGMYSQAYVDEIREQFPEQLCILAKSPPSGRS